MRKILFSIGLMFLTKGVWASNSIQPITIPTSLFVSSFTVAGGTATVTISTPPAPGQSAGWYNYITNIHIEEYATSTLTGGATPVICKTTGLPVNGQYIFPTALATGTQQTLDMQFANPLQSIEGTQVTVSCPGQPNTYWNVQVSYFQNP